ncbi:MAG TPA: cytochrome P450 [Acidimicrobiales bacterium]
MATRVDELDLPVLDLLSAPDQAERVRRLNAAREQGWLAKTDLGYSVLTYDDCVAFLRDQRWHQLASRLPEIAGVTDPDYLGRRRTSILTAEGAEHARLRRLVAPAFTPKAADRFRPYMREVISRLVDPHVPTGRIELCEDVCDPYPIPIICKLLGAPEEDWKLFSRWAADLLRIFNANLIEDLPIIMAAQDEMGAYVAELIVRRRATPGDDLITALIAAHDEGDHLDDDELQSMAVAVLVGGTDTTRNQLACTVALFTQHPDQWRLLGERPELASRAVEESMRILGAIRGTGRFAIEDIEYKGVLFPKDTFLSPSFVAANRDRTIYDDADTFDICRAGDTKPHLTFGSGIHHCLGAWLARAELQEALPLLAQRMPDLEVDGAIEWKPNGFGIWGPSRLPLQFTPG